MNRLDDAALAARVARDIPDGAYVNLGIGKPTHVAAHVPEGRTVTYHAENGIVGVGPAPGPNEADPELIDASKRMVTAARGAASKMSRAISFVTRSSTRAKTEGGRNRAAVFTAELGTRTCRTRWPDSTLWETMRRHCMATRRVGRCGFGTPGDPGRQRQAPA